MNIEEIEISIKLYRGNVYFLDEENGKLSFLIMYDNPLYEMLHDIKYNIDTDDVVVENEVNKYLTNSDWKLPNNPFYIDLDDFIDVIWCDDFEQQDFEWYISRRACIVTVELEKN